MSKFSGVGAVGAVEILDINRDGKKDLVLESYGSLSLFLGNADNTFGAPLTTNLNASWLPQIMAGDLNGDGSPDLVVLRKSTSDTVSVLSGNGDGTLQARVDYPTLLGASGLSLVDIDGDLDTDVIVANQNTSYFSVFANTGTGALGAPTNYATQGPSYGVQVGDLNGDGFVDVVLSLSAGFQVFMNNGAGTFVGRSAIILNPGGYRLALGDVDGDSKVDIVLAAYSAQAVRIYFGIGDGSFDWPLSLSIEHYAESVALADLNGDGDLDIVVGQYTSTGGLFNVLTNLKF